MLSAIIPVTKILYFSCYLKLDCSVLLYYIIDFELYCFALLLIQFHLFSYLVVILN